MKIRQNVATLGSVSGPPTPRTLLSVLLVAELTALGAATVFALAAVGLLGAGVDVTGLVASHMTAAADVLSTVSPTILGGWILYTYMYLFVYLFVALLVSALLCRSLVASTIWTQATRLVSSVLTRLALGWCHHYPKSPHLPKRTDVLRGPAHDHPPDHVATGWRAEVHPALTYE